MTIDEWYTGWRRPPNPYEYDSGDEYSEDMETWEAREEARQAAIEDAYERE